MAQTGVGRYYALLFLYRSFHELYLCGVDVVILSDQLSSRRQLKEISYMQV